MALLLISAARLEAQDHHRFEASLDPVAQDGCYRITLKPEVTGRSYSNWQDVRLLDATGKQIPYLLDNGLSTEIEALDFPVIATGTDTARQYYIILENARQLYLDNLKLDIENTEATRSLTLSGSDDRTTWYAIREDFYWEQSAVHARTLTFPASHYRYLRIAFNGAGKLPVKILRANTYAPHATTANRLRIPTPRLIQKDSGRNSYITVLFDRVYKIDRLAFHISGPRYFHRAADITGGNGDLNHTYLTELSSGTQTITASFTSNRLLFRIYNEDNPPVRMDTVTAYQDAQFLIAYVEAGKAYTLTFGDSTAREPVYDLSYFRDSIGKQIPELELGPVREVKARVLRAGPAGRDYKWVLWVVIAAVLAGLLWMTAKLLQQVNGRPGS